VLYEKKGAGYKQYLMDIVQELGLEKNVIFTGFRDDVPDIMREIDVFVIASKTPDPCPTSLLQAMASGPAVIATDFGGPAEIIQDGIDGLLYAACDYHELAEKMLYLIENREKRDMLAEQAQKKIKIKFNYRDYLHEVKKIIDEVIAVNDIYSSGEYAQNNPSWHKEDAKWKAEKINQLLSNDFLSQFTKGIDIIDIGCGTGEVLKLVSGHLKKKNISVNPIGYDLSADIIQKAMENFPLGSFKCAGFEKGSYFKKQGLSSIAMLIDILEHMQDPAVLLKNIKESFDYALCHLPLEDNFEVNIRGKKDQFTKVVGHVHFYNKKTALKLFKDCGFKVKDLIYTCSDVSADYILKSLPRRFIAQPLRKVFFKCFPQFTASVLGNCSLMVLLEPKTESKD